MPRYVAFLRAVGPMNASMPALRNCFERAGFARVTTVLSSGNVVFDARAASERALERKAEAAMAKALGRTFFTFLRQRHGGKLRRPLEADGARILSMKHGEVFTAYVPGPRGPVFTRLIEKTFGTGVTTRTWDTVKKCAAA